MILKINWKLLKAVILLNLVLVISSCTAVGILADTAIQSAINDNIERRNGQRHKNESEPFFTKKGFEQDVKFIKFLMATLPDKKVNAVPQRVNQKSEVACKSSSDGQKQCYSHEYYKSMYITDSLNRVQEAKLHKE